MISLIIKQNGIKYKNSLNLNKDYPLKISYNKVVCNICFDSTNVNRIKRGFILRLFFPNTLRFKCSCCDRIFYKRMNYKTVD
jgi:hypothetical protein